MPTKATQAEMYAFFEHYDSVNGTENSYEKSMAYMCEELDSYFGDELGSLDSVKEEIAGLKEMYQSVIDDLKAAKEAALKESETEQSEDSDFRQMLTEYMASMIEKIKNGEIDQEFQIGSISLTLEEWDELIDKFDDLEEKITEAVKAEIKNRLRQSAQPKLQRQMIQSITRH